MLYSDGATIKVGDVVTERGLERFVVIGFEGGNSVKMILIGTVQKEGSPSFGETLIMPLPKGYVRSVPSGAIRRIGSARINVVEDDPII